MGGLSLKYLPDTHTWIWWHTKPEKLSEKVRTIIEQVDYDELLLSAITPWEFCKLIEKGRLTINEEPLEWIKNALKFLSIRLIPLTPEIACLSISLPGSFHDDPADQIIVASAKIESATILTRDERILKYNQVLSLWR